MDVSKHEVPPDQLRWRCDPAQFDFDCTADLAPLHEFIGQDRAIRAIEFGLSMQHDGFNIFLSGLTGTGKTSVARTYIRKLISEREARGESYRVSDWCYIYNFVQTDRPRMVELSRGKGREFRDDIAGLLQHLKKDLTRAFSTDEYKDERKALIEEGQTRQQEMFTRLRTAAQKKGFLIQMTQVGAALVPLKNGKALSQDEFLALDVKERNAIERTRNGLRKGLEELFEESQDIERVTTEKVQESDRKVAEFTVSRSYDTLERKYVGSTDIVQFLKELKAYTLDRADSFKGPQEEKPESFLSIASEGARPGDVFLPFQVNVFVDNGATQGPPIVVETNPNYVNLFGKVERRFVLGGYISDHTMLKPGALHLANGGYLLLSAVDVLSNPAVWPALKRALKTRELGIEEPFEQMGLIAPQGLRPLPAPVDVKVILIGDSNLYHLLSAYDEDFWEIFKVKADFDYEVSRTPENTLAYAAFIAGCCKDCELRHFDRTGVARVVEYASRMVSDQRKLSSRFAFIKELIEEAEYWARKEGAALVNGTHVQKAIEERRFRHNLSDIRLRDMIADGTILIDTEGEVVGQVNGLSVYSLGDIMFGKPSRITCRTFLGKDGVINIERESNLSGSSHDKGVLIMGGYLGWKYAQDAPLSLSATLCFEQSYGGVDGDSASCAELYVLLSSLAEAPLRQDVAVTGSVNQRGEVQPIGGVNQKIEGFYQICLAKGLTGTQGVMIPRRNLQNLSLREEVVEAVRAGRFHVYAVDSVDEGLELLCGVPAGRKRKDGCYPARSLNGRVVSRLETMAGRLKEFQSAGFEAHQSSAGCTGTCGAAER
ncbi:MAG: AAA family ATPase [Dehalococcoidia bacterium]|jgi:predicted ATP-dependent protease|nr:AAA family ATPase [Dehalococcoidia bacterium]